ncbi:NAD-dependent dehydratase [Panacibacter ginsenosidivorans]|uniref:NAD-dependent dehydratase n=1 Tax=Panacibacter ginsenosidivorans TaxID=1813871 RepID=A0A5B8VDZ6_9BACT|nr:NmrA family NAD(P)-binding protein [Panacibacter ginsenosidivorans]QEC69479.1 NAD-dependent dehydratase [Panacibacter ginsenosidivorans]
MKYVITGSLGNIGLPVTKALLKAGHDVTVITSKQQNVEAIEALGAKAAVGSVEDVDFLTKTFAGANAVYTMVPPNFGAAEWKKWIGSIGKNYADAIKANGIKYVVNLSSVGAHRENGVGPVSGLHLAEEALNSLTDVNIKHLRPAYFYQNLFSNIGLIKNAGIIGSNFNVTGNKFGLVDPSDIAAVAIETLLQLNFTGHSIRYIVSDEVSTNAIANEIGKAIGKPDLAWVSFTNEQAYDGMKQAGLPEEITKNYVEMGEAVNSGIMYEDYWKNHPSTLGKTKLADFAKIFAAAYNAN